MPKLIPPMHIHLVGIGGAGLSAIARILIGQGYTVSGSDRTANPHMEALEALGARVFVGHDAAHISGADAILMTSAVKTDHVEVAAAMQASIPVYKRQDIMADLMAGQHVIAVAGTHGKTTTTSMVVHVLRENGLDPSYIVGGIVRSTGDNARVGRTPIFVIEADEYDNMFHGLRPDTAVVTSIEYDHPDFFLTEAAMLDSFAQFVHRMSENGTLIACSDEPHALALTTGRKALTYGQHSGLWRVEKAESGGFIVIDTAANRSYTLALRVPGTHNALNATAAALAASSAAGLTIDVSLGAVASFEGTGRRFDLRADVYGVAVVDDYAHHPTAIRATLEAARQRYPDRDIWAVWQPHTFSRTRALWEEYKAAFAGADHVLVTDIYAAREQPTQGVTSAALVAEMQHVDVRHTGTLQKTAQVLQASVKPGACIIIMSAGDAPQIGVDFLALRGGNPPEVG